MSTQPDFQTCPACSIERVADSFVGGVCNFCYDAGRTTPGSEKPLDPPPKPARRTKRAVIAPAEPAPTPERDAGAASAEPYSPPQFDAVAAAASPQAEMAARVLARRHLLPFLQRFRPKYDAGWVHVDICRRLERFLKAVENGEEPRLLLMCPPRLGKSEIGSRHFSPWVLGQHPDWEIIAASHTTSLSMSFSRYIRDLLRDSAYQAVFPNAILDPQSQSTENWNLTAGGGYLAAGVGSAITGRGAHILILDDLVKDIEAADSATQCDATWEWYISTAHSRLAPGGGVLGIMTWWSENDWAGRIQQVMAKKSDDGITDEEGGERFEIVRYPAINEVGDEYILADDSIAEIPPGAPVPPGATMTRPKGTALHPARYTTAAMLRKKANYIAAGMKRMWDALYQQNPTPDEGIYFGKDMFRYYVHKPDLHGRFVYQAWDFAITTGAQNDWTVGTTLLQDEYDNLYVLDVLRFRSDDSIEICETILDYQQQWGAQLLGFEDGQIWKTLAAQFKKRCEERKIYPTYELLVPLTDKMVRASPLKGRMQIGKVYFPKNASWFPEQQKEMLRFPAGKHDDQVDSLAWCVRLTLTRSAPKMPQPKEMRSWRDKLRGLGGSGDSSHMASSRLTL
ncbi:MAG: terminase large subunit domain-containing protein [Burkholderiales bacterium]